MFRQMWIFLAGLAVVLSVGVGESAGADGPLDRTRELLKRHLSVSKFTAPIESVSTTRLNLLGELLGSLRCGWRFSEARAEFSEGMTLLQNDGDSHREASWSPVGFRFTCNQAVRNHVVTIFTKSGSEVFLRRLPRSPDLGSQDFKDWLARIGIWAWSHQVESPSSPEASTHELYVVGDEIQALGQLGLAFEDSRRVTQDWLSYLATRNTEEDLESVIALAGRLLMFSRKSSNSDIADLATELYETSASLVDIGDGSEETRKVKELIETYIEAFRKMAGSDAGSDVDEEALEIAVGIDSKIENAFESRNSLRLQLEEMESDFEEIEEALKALEMEGY